MTARRLQSQRPSSRQARISLLYQLAVSRDCTTDERRRAVQFLDKYIPKHRSTGVTDRDADDAGETAELKAWAALAQAIFASAEFRYVY
jgi:hypothetical protein